MDLLDLDKTIKLLTANDATTLSSLSFEPTVELPPLVNTKTNTHTALFFSSTWCDWYLEESRPEMSRNCINAQNQVNALYRINPKLNWVGIFSRFWTGDKKLKEYKNKYHIEHPLAIDANDQEFFRYKVKISQH